MLEVVVVTGASAGVGRAVTREFARHGTRLGLLARGRQRLESAKREVASLGGEALVLPADVADPDQVEQAAAEVERAFGPVDIWVNNAMSSVFAPFSEVTPEEFKRVTEVTYLGYVYGTMAALRRMRPRNQGTVVQVGSALAYRSIPLQSAYCGAKHAIVGFTDSIRSELHHDGSNVHVTVVHLPAMNTPQFSWCNSKLPRHPQPVPPIYEPKVAAKAIYWAAHQRRREVYVAFSTLKAIYGQMVAPGYADRYLGENGYESQQTDEAVKNNHTSNLFEPAGDDCAARGIFSGRAKQWSLQSWANMHGQALAGVVAGSCALAAAILLARR